MCQHQFCSAQISLTASLQTFGLVARTEVERRAFCQHQFRSGSRSLPLVPSCVPSICMQHSSRNCFASCVCKKAVKLGAGASMHVLMVCWLSVDERSLRWARDEICAMSNLFGGRCCRDSAVCPNRALCAQRLQRWSDSACSGCSFEVSSGTWPSERSVGICERMRKRIGTRIQVWISWTQSC